MIKPDLIMDVFDGNQTNPADANTKCSSKISDVKDLFNSMVNKHKIKRIFSKSESGSLFWSCL
jgi:hypothetical protein